MFKRAKHTKPTCQKIWNDTGLRGYGLGNGGHIQNNLIFSYPKAIDVVVKLGEGERWERLLMHWRIL